VSIKAPCARRAWAETLSTTHHRHWRRCFRVQVIPALAGDATEQTPPDLPSYLFKERIVYVVSYTTGISGRAARLPTTGLAWPSGWALFVLRPAPIAAWSFQAVAGWLFDCLVMRLCGRHYGFPAPPANPCFVWCLALRACRWCLR
jgi:hypothetical protein